MSSQLGKQVSKLFFAATAGLLVYPSQTTSPQSQNHDPLQTTTSFVQPLAQQDSSAIFPPRQTPHIDSSQAELPLKNAYKYCYKDKYAAIVIDAVTGDVIYNFNGFKLLHPASTIKNMTALLTFKAIESGELSMDDKLTIREDVDYKAGIGLCTMGIKPGEDYRVKDALKGIVTKSAADATIPLAERISGSEKNFADEMTSYGKKLGLLKSTFKNSSGATHAKQLSCAYDMAQLMRGEMQYFSEHCVLYKTTSFSFHEKPVRGHKQHNEPFKNHALFADVDMAKTGFLNASGYNTVGTVVRNNRRYIFAIFGGKTQPGRNAHALEAVDRAVEIAEATRPDYTDMPVNNTADFALFPAKRDFRELDMNPEERISINTTDLLTPKRISAPIPFAPPQIPTADNRLSLNL